MQAPPPVHMNGRLDFCLMQFLTRRLRATEAEHSAHSSFIALLRSAVYGRAHSVRPLAEPGSAALRMTLAGPMAIRGMRFECSLDPMLDSSALELHGNAATRPTTCVCVCWGNNHAGDPSLCWKAPVTLATCVAFRQVRFEWSCFKMPTAWACLRFTKCAHQLLSPSPLGPLWRFRRVTLEPQVALATDTWAVSALSVINPHLGTTCM